MPSRNAAQDKTKSLKLDGGLKKYKFMLIVQESGVNVEFFMACSKRKRQNVRNGQQSSCPSANHLCICVI